MNIYLSFGIGILSGIICARLAKQRGRSAEYWFILGMLFGFISMIALYLLPRNNGKTKKEQNTTASATQRVAMTPDPRYQDWFFLDQQAKQHGPVSFRHLYTAWQESRLTKESYVWTEGMGEWKTIQHLPSLLDRLS